MEDMACMGGMVRKDRRGFPTELKNLKLKKQVL